MGFGSFIREKREQANLPMNEFARKLDISPAYWSRIERELEKPPKDELIVRAATEAFPDSVEISLMFVDGQGWCTAITVDRDEFVEWIQP